MCRLAREETFMQTFGNSFLGKSVRGKNELLTIGRFAYHSATQKELPNDLLYLLYVDRVISYDIGKPLLLRFSFLHR